MKFSGSDNPRVLVEWKNSIVVEKVAEGGKD
jgi:hypothetical protein